jgi:uncharacterized protein (TIGR01244 family)
MSITVNQLNDEISTAPQLAPEHMAAVAAAGYRSVINNRPDFEGGAEQPTSAAMEAAALAAGLEYAHLPVQGSFQTPEQAQAMAELMARLPKPVMAFCRSGARSTKLYMLSREVDAG